MPKGGKRRTHYFSVQPEGFSAVICLFILPEYFQWAVYLNVRLSMTFHVEYVVKKVPLQQVSSECFYLHLSVSNQHALYSLIYHQRYITPDCAFKQNN